jgi:hypothetical protein
MRRQPLRALPVIGELLRAIAVWLIISEDGGLILWYRAQARNARGSYHLVPLSLRRHSLPTPLDSEAKPLALVQHHP